MVAACGAVDPSEWSSEALGALSSGALDPDWVNYEALGALSDSNALGILVESCEALDVLDGSHSLRSSLAALIAVLAS